MSDYLSRFAWIVQVDASFWPSLITALPPFTLRSVLVCLTNSLVTLDSKTDRASEANPAPPLS